MDDRPLPSDDPDEGIFYYGDLDNFTEGSDCSDDDGEDDDDED